MSTLNLQQQQQTLQTQQQQPILQQQPHQQQQHPQQQLQQLQQQTTNNIIQQDEEASGFSLACTICDKQFASNEVLKRHMKTHIGSSCHLCLQTFKDRLALARHQVEEHTMDRTFPCTQCDKTFKEVRTLRLHLKIHNSEYPEQCGVCCKVFRTKWQLKQHLMDHGGERPYPCPECTFTCKTKQQLNEHRRKHSGEKAYSCPQCGTRFTYRNGLIKHTKLNRCPKKLVTAEGETIIKKRSRVLSKFALQVGTDKNNNNSISNNNSNCISNNNNNNNNITTNNNNNNSNDKNLNQSEKSNFDAKVMDALYRRSLIQKAGTGNDVFEFGVTDRNFNVELIKKEHGATGLSDTTQGTQAGLIGGVGGNSLPTTTLQGVGIPRGGSGSPLGGAGGSPATILTTSADISSWAATLPAGTKVTVTHYDASKRPGQGELVATPTHTETILVTEKTEHMEKQMIQNNIVQRRLQLSGKMGGGPLPTLQSPPGPSHYHTQEALNLFSSIGFQNYSESFAVDPNEILRAEKCVKSEPATPLDLQDFKPNFNLNSSIKREDFSQVKSEPMDFYPVNEIKQEVLSQLFDCEPNPLTPSVVSRPILAPLSIPPCNLISGSSENMLVQTCHQQQDVTMLTPELNLSMDIKREPFSPLASPDSGYGDSCYQLGQQMGENMQVHKGDQMEAHLGENLGDAMGLIDKPINHQFGEVGGETSFHDHSNKTDITRVKTELSEFDVDFNELLDEIHHTAADFDFRPANHIAADFDFRPVAVDILASEAFRENHFMDLVSSV